MSEEHLEPAEPRTKPMSPPTINLRFRLGLIAVVAALLCLLFAADAGAHVYWAGSGSSSVGRASDEGTEIDPGLITTPSGPWGIAVAGNHVYWSSLVGGSIGRANLDGTEVKPQFITGLGYNIFSIAVAGSHVYWTSLSGNIGRANIETAGELDKEFIPGVTGAYGALAVADGHIYWTNPNNGKIGRADLAGDEIEDEFIVPKNPASYGLAVSGGHIYWSGNGGKIGRADVESGGGIEESFVTGVGEAAALVVDGGHIYWTNTGSQAIGRADLDGSGVTPTFIPAGSFSYGIATDNARPLPGRIAGSAFLVRVTGRDEKNGTGKVDVRVPGEGTITVTGPHTETKVRSVTAAGTFDLPLIPAGSFKTHLENHQRGYATFTVSFAPTGGQVASKTLRARLVMAAASSSTAALP